MSAAWQLALGIIGAVGGICGLIAVFYAWRQTKVMSDDIRSRKQQEAEEIEWAARFELVMNQLLRINPLLQVQEPGASVPINLYQTIFPDLEFRKAVESYIVQLDRSQTQFLPRRPRPDELRSANMRKTLEKAETLLKAFRQNHPGAVHHLG